MPELDPDKEIEPLDAIGVLMALEEVCSVQISESEAKKIRTVQDAMDITTRVISEQPAKWYQGKVKQ
jgi:acyl carrier protein